MKKFTQGKTFSNVNSVASVLSKQETQGYMKAFTLEKSSLNVNSVASVLVKQETYVRLHKRVHTGGKPYEFKLSGKFFLPSRKPQET